MIVGHTYNSLVDLEQLKLLKNTPSQAGVTNLVNF